MHRLAFLIALGLAGPSFSQVATPTPQLPAYLATLYHSYPQLHETLGAYADSQGFTGPKERLATILHELVHVDSAAKNAYLIQGQTYAPYNQPEAWPAFRFAQFQDALSKSHDPVSQSLVATPVYRLYVINIPNNTLASLADELNAYGQTAKWLCKATPFDRNERSKTLDSLRDMLRITNAYLGILRSVAPAQYTTFYAYQKPARNLLALTADNALSALSVCGQQLQAADRQEVDALTTRAKAEALRNQ